MKTMSFKDYCAILSNIVAANVVVIFLCFVAWTLFMIVHLVSQGAEPGVAVIWGIIAAGMSLLFATSGSYNPYGYVPLMIVVIVVALTTLITAICSLGALYKSDTKRH
jgi:drug/metabolite transporter (DMT)-like permease